MNLASRDGTIYLDGEVLTAGDQAYADRLAARYPNAASLRLVFGQSTGPKPVKKYEQYRTRDGKVKTRLVGYLWKVTAPGFDDLQIVARNTRDARQDAARLWRRQRLPAGATIEKVME